MHRSATLLLLVALIACGPKQRRNPEIVALINGLPVVEASVILSTYAPHYVDICIDAALDPTISLPDVADRLGYKRRYSKSFERTGSRNEYWSDGKGVLFFRGLKVGATDHEICSIGVKTGAVFTSANLGSEISRSKFAGDIVWWDPDDPAAVYGQGFARNSESASHFFNVVRGTYGNSFDGVTSPQPISLQTTKVGTSLERLPTAKMTPVLEFAREGG